MVGRVSAHDGAVLLLTTSLVPSENTIRRGSSGSTLVSMMESPDLGERDDLSEILVVGRPPFLRALLER